VDGEWRAVVDFGGAYLINRTGQVYSVPRILSVSGSNGRYEKRICGRFLRPARHKSGGLQKVVLSADGIRRSRYIAHLVAEAFGDD
jgi:hypothetical protein